MSHVVPKPALSFFVYLKINYLDKRVLKKNYDNFTIYEILPKKNYGIKNYFRIFLRKIPLLELYTQLIIKLFTIISHYGVECVCMMGWMDPHIGVIGEFKCFLPSKPPSHGSNKLTYPPNGLYT